MGGKTRLLILLATILGCADGQELKRETRTVEDGTWNGDSSEEFFAPEDAASETEQTLCIYRSDDDIFGSVTVKSADQGSDAACIDASAGERFTVYKDQPYIVHLHGNAGEEYCLEVIRHSGYITLSHKTGTVRRDGSVFTWCVVHGLGEAERVLVRSLTPSAQITLAVP